MRRLQLTSVHFWFCFDGLHEPHTIRALWLDWIHSSTICNSKYFERFLGGCNYHQSGVSASFVGLCEPCTTLTLWLGWTRHYYGTWTLTMITQSWKIRQTGGWSSSKLHQFRKMPSILKGCEGVAINISAIQVCFCGITWSSWNLGFMACLDAQFYNM